jgi:hypothetical protein
MKTRGSHYIAIIGFVPLILAAALILSAGTARQDRVGAASRPWPLPISVSLSSSFGEYRDGHIHAGLDLRTHGREGIVCRAVGDGAITRMRASSGGYGKALYLKLVTGETVVYAHLSEFSADYEQYLCDAQAERGTYRVDLSIPASRFPVREGDTIGYTGSTGSQAPHLHFEVRDIRENPVNPLSRGWKLIDDQEPSPHRILWIPVTAGSTVDGLVMPRDVALERIAPGRYAALDTVTIAGSAGIGIFAIDRSDESSGKLAPSKVELAVDGAIIARIERERFSYAQTSEVALEYEMERVRTRGEHFLLLFERAGETLGGRMFVGGGLVRTDSAFAPGIPASAEPDGVRTARIELHDKNGNRTSVTAPFRMARGGSGEPPHRRRPPSGKTIFGFNEYLSIGGGFTVTDIEERRDAPPPAAAGGFSQDMVSQGVITLDAAAGRPVILAAKEHRGIPYIYCLPVPQGEPVTFPIPDLGVTLRSRSSSVFSSTFMTLSGEAADRLESPEAQGLIPESEPVNFGPWSLAIRSRVDLDFALSRPVTGREAVYRWIPGSRLWSCAPSRAGGDTVSASVRVPGIYRVCTDIVPPVIKPPSLTSRTMYSTGITYPEIVCVIMDAGSGVDAAAIDLLFDGRKVIGRWDAFGKKMFILLRRQNIIGEHSVTVVARDLVGNETRVHTTLNFPAATHPDTSDGSN